MSVPTEIMCQVKCGYNISKQEIADGLKGFDDEYLQDLLEAAINGREAVEAREPDIDATFDVLLRLVQPTLWGELVRRLELEELEGPSEYEQP